MSEGKNMEFTKPKLKRKRTASVGTALREKEQERDGPRYSGVLVGGSVLVQDASDVTGLVGGGFYGTRVFSRRFPTYMTTAESSTRGTSSDEYLSGGRPRRKRARVTREGGGGSAGEKTSGREEETGDTAREEEVERSVREKEGSQPHMDTLCLTSEEAFYLTAEVNKLDVYPSTNVSQCWSNRVLWGLLCASHSQFPYTYSVYRHYRLKGWVVRSGLKFGVDFLLYKDGPEAYHSSYAVVVVGMVDETPDRAVGGASSTGESGVSAEVQAEVMSTGSREGEEGAGSRLRWVDVIAHCRVSESTAKELVVCYVSLPPGCGEAASSSSPDWVDHVSIHEVLVTRWLPEKDR